MAPPALERRLIINADDFGASSSINQAVIRAHREGVLTTASLMVNGEAFDEAVALARENPDLGVGLHLTLVMGKSTLPPEKIPGLVDAKGRFSNHAAATGFRYFFNRKLREPLHREIEAQLLKFRGTGLKLDHLNGHLNLHLHPAILRTILELAPKHGIRQIRVTRDPFLQNARIAGGAWFYRSTHALIFALLSRRARPRLKQAGIGHTRNVFGLLQNARVNEEYLMRLIPRLPEGDCEIYSHPSLDQFREEFEALISPRVRDQIRKEKIRCIRYQDLQA